MSQRSISLFLGVYIIYLLIGVVFKIDYFPLTWAPMYAAIKSTEEYKITKMDKKEVKEEGFLVKHQDGTTSNITFKDLNIPFRNFYPIYSQRIYNIGPPKHRRAIDQYGKINTIEIDWETRLFNVLNNTLGYQESDPKFIVEISASKTILIYTDTKTNIRLDRSIEDVITIKWGQPGESLKNKPFLVGLDE